MIKAIILDMDGVIRFLDEEKSEIAVQKIGFSVEEIMKVLWANQWGKDLLRGKISRDIWWDNVRQKDRRLGNIEQDYFWNSILEESWIDRKLLEYVYNIPNHIGRFILTNCDAISKQTIFSALGMNHMFDHIFSTSDLGYVKPETEVYQRMLNIINCSAEECLFFDDKQENVDGALNLGVKAYLYQGLKQLKDIVESILEEK